MMPMTLEVQNQDHQRMMLAGEICPFVFVRMVADGRGGNKHPRRIVSLNKAWAAACIAAGCPGRIPHDLRRTAIRNMVRRSVPERVAMMLTGHKTRSIFERYNIVSDGDLRTAAAQLSGLTAGVNVARSATR
jgi:integrase